MDTRDVTFRISAALFAKVEALAAARGVSVNALVVESLARPIRDEDEGYADARARQQALMCSKRTLRQEGERFAGRNALHER